MNDSPSVLKALSDPTRREIIDLLKKEGRMAAGDISSHFSITQATISHHLAILAAAKLITIEHEGKYIYYELNTTVLEDILSWIVNLIGGKKDEKENSK